MWEKVKNLNVKNGRIKLLQVSYLLLTIAIFFRLTLVHHTHQQNYQVHLTKQEKYVLKKSQPRGEIYDRHGNPLVINNPALSIVYYYDSNRSVQQMYAIADQLAGAIEVDTQKLSTNDLHVLYRRLNHLEDDQPIEEEQLDTLRTQDKASQVIFNRMINAVYGGGVSVIKLDATDVEIAFVVERLDHLSGVNVEMLSEREYPSIIGHHDLLGAVNKDGSGLPDTDFNYFAELGYTMNDRIGLSSLERHYEDFLHGSKSMHLVNSDQPAVTLYDGMKGFDLTLTIDAELSAKIDTILERHMVSARQNRLAATYLQEGYIVIVDPNNGEILSLNGKVLDENNQLQDHPLGNLHNAFTMGSVVKGATMITAYQQGITSFGDITEDKAMIFADGTKKASWSDLGVVNDIDALRLSSNVYFMQQAIRMGGDHYFPRTNLNIDLTAINTYRSSFENFGLGTYTGVDLPGEQIGLRDPDKSIAKLLDLSIGQSDTYTPLQLAQYISTIANGGSRYALHLLKDASIKIDDQTQILVHDVEPYLLNKIDVSPEGMNRIQEGFRQVLQAPTGTGNHFFKNSPHHPAGKTGTAEEFARDREGNLMYSNRGELIPIHHLTFVGYAPAYNPEIAIAIVFPQAELPDKNNPISLEVANEVINTYFEHKKETMP